MNRNIPYCVTSVMKRIRQTPAGETYADAIFAA